MLKTKYSRIYSCALFGINGVLVEIEVSIHPGLSVFEIVGLGDCAVRESRNRVRAAIRNNGFEFPAGRIIVGMAPGFIRKEGTAYDLPIAIGILSASGQIGVIPKDVCIVGEMSLSGDVKSIPGTINRILTASQEGYKRIIIPHLNVAEGSFVRNIEIFGVCTLKEVIGLIDGKSKWNAIKAGDINPDPQNCNIKDISTIIGQSFAVRALIIAAVGKHHILMVGGPGCGKTSLASVMPGILPDPDEKERIEITKIYSSCGMIKELQGNCFRRPFRTPHHNATISAITGGGLFPVPGEITLAHGGVLFLDEMNEFPQKILDQLRKPLEEQKISICRNKYTVEYPADFILIGATNPCSCGNLLERNPKYPCTCSQQTIKKYLDHISGPLFDRIDIYTELFRVSHENLPQSIREQNSSDSKTIRNHLMRTWDIQKRRCIRHQIQPFLNSRLPTELVTKVFELHDDIIDFSSEVAGRLNLTVRSYQKMIRIARSIADYDNEEHISRNHLAQAVQFRRK